MGRVAVVTGGTRGIGAAISKALKQEGYKVVASYAGNDEAAQKFKAENGIAVKKWDVGNYEACASNLKAIESEVGKACASATSGASSISPRSTARKARWGR
jgi:acetoacetyl-CoA reductase